MMDLASFWKLLNLDIGVDLSRKTYSITVGPLSIKDIPFASMKSMTENTPLIEMLLTKHFIQRRIMHMDFRRETVQDCTRSLRELQRLNEDQSKEFAASRKESDRIFSSMLLAWASECSKASAVLEDALRDEKDPINTGMGISARDWIPDALADMRKASYPTVEFLTLLLPDDNPVRKQASAALKMGSDLLIRHYGVGSHELTPPDLELQPG
jgi:hypothetical protein